jgi:hypothetical protein
MIEKWKKKLLGSTGIKRTAQNPRSNVVFPWSKQNKQIYLLYLPFAGLEMEFSFWLVSTIDEIMIRRAELMCKAE